MEQAWGWKGRVLVERAEREVREGEVMSDFVKGLWLEEVEGVGDDAH